MLAVLKVSEKNKLQTFKGCVSLPNQRNRINQDSVDSSRSNN